MIAYAARYFAGRDMLAAVQDAYHAARRMNIRDGMAAFQ